jgi:thioredoxin reductase
MLARRAFIGQTGLMLSGMFVFMPRSILKNEEMNSKQLFDVIIIGGSYAGLAAGMALGRAMRKVLIIDSGNPCNKQTPYSHNFLTNDGKTPGEISKLAKEQVMVYSSVHFIKGQATAVVNKSNGFDVQIETGETYHSRKLVFATGIKDIMPEIPGLSESWGISVLHCPYCHGYEVRHQKTAILANGDAGFELSSLISNWTTDITLYTNGTATLTAQQRTKLLERKIKVSEAAISRLENKDGYLEHIVFTDGTKDPVKAMYARLPFIQHSLIPQTIGCEITQDGYIKIDSAHRTTVPGVYACGDNVTRMRTVANAVAMGTTTGMMVNKELIEEDF